MNNSSAVSAGENSCNWSITVPILPFLHHERALNMVLRDDVALCAAPLIYLLQPWPPWVSSWRERSTSWLWLNGSGSAAADEWSQKILQVSMVAATCLLPLRVDGWLPCYPTGRYLRSDCTLCALRHFIPHVLQACSVMLWLTMQMYRLTAGGPCLQETQDLLLSWREDGTDITNFQFCGRFLVYFS